MSTSAQIGANRANSRNSTGPRTEAGKAASAQNARSHGLTGRDLVLGPGQQEEFDALQTGLYDDVLPQGTLEDELFKSLVHAAWNQRRCRRAEAALAAKCAAPGHDPLLDPSLAAELKLLDLYARRATAAFHKSMKTIREHQTERLARKSLAQACPSMPDASLLGLSDVPGVYRLLLKNRSQSDALEYQRLLALTRQAEAEVERDLAAYLARQAPTAA